MTPIDEIAGIVRKHLDKKRSEFIPGKSRIPLAVPSFGSDEIVEAIRSLLEFRTTMGAKVQKFERMFADYIGLEHGVMMNSGSSANLVALSILRYSGRLSPGDEVITPAVTWSTTVFPIVNVGAVPVFVDVNLNTYNVEPAEVEKAITEKTKVLMPVHLLGNPCDIERIMDLARERGLHVIEDCCEAPGAELNGKKVGSFGDISTFSTFFSHHITTGEGGLLLTNNDFYANLARSMRAHGWIRERDDQEKIEEIYSHLDPRFLFVSMGYNLRPMEIAGAFGIHQIGKLDGFIRIRQENAEYWTKELERFSEYFVLPKARQGARHVYFGYPLTIKPTAPFVRAELTSFLESSGVETRPIMAGDMTQQPAMKELEFRAVGELKNAKIIERQSFFWGNHHGIGKDERKYILEVVKEFVESKGG